jgi:hypothetical protein
MAFTAGNIGDQSGIGQGLAFVLPEGKSATYAMQLAQTHASQLQQMAKEKLLMQQKAQLQYENDFKDQKLPKAFAPFDQQLNDRFNKWIQKGAKQYATTGKNPYNDPHFMAEYNDQILTPANKSLELGQNYTKLRAIAETDPTNKYTKESKQAVIDYEQKIKDDPFGSMDKPLPQLVETPAGINEAVKVLKPSGDVKYNESQAFSLLGDPKFHDYFKSMGYDTDLPDASAYVYEKDIHGKDIASTGHRVFPTTDDYAYHQADEWLSNPYKEVNLKKLGIQKDDPDARESLANFIKNQNDGANKAVQAISSRLTDPEKVQQLKDQQQALRDRQTSLYYQGQNLKIAQHREQRLSENQNTDKFINTIFEGNGGADSLEGLNAISKAYEGNGSYRQGLQNLKDDGETVTFTIPAKKKLNPSYNPNISPQSKFYQPQYTDAQPAIPMVLHRSEPAAFKAGLYEALKNVGSPTQIGKFISGKPIKDTKTPEKKSESIKGTTKSIWDN